MENEIRARMESLLRYREALDESERELFDILMGYAREVMTATGVREGMGNC